MAEQTLRTRFRQAPYTASQLTAANPTLLAGEVLYERDTGRCKIGDGTTPWDRLPYGGREADNPTVTSSTLTVQGGNQYRYTGTQALTVSVDSSIVAGDAVLIVPANAQVTFANAEPSKIILLQEENLSALSTAGEFRIYTIHAVKPTDASKALAAINGATYKLLG